jgi:uncharacterized protein (DUF1330 family)
MSHELRTPLNAIIGFSEVLGERMFGALKASLKRRRVSTMPAYAIGRLQMRDPSWAKEYGTRIQALLTKHGGRYLVRAGKMETVEGSTPLPSAIVVLEFPSIEHARAWYRDPEYAPLIKLRQVGSDLDLVRVEGV